MAAPPASSRLEMLQARFQQKQLQEKEQKLLQLYDQQQQRAYQVVQKGSAGSTASNHGSSVSQHTVTRSTTTTHSTATSQGGKVRQMFDERRQTTVKGIDRSYPLEPLDNKPRKLTAGNNGNVTPKNNDGTVNRQTVTVRRVARADVNSNVNGGKPVVSYREEISREEFHGDDNEFGNENDDDDDNDGNRSSVNRNEVSIEEIIDDDTIGRNRMMAKIHLMDFDKNMKYRVNNDLESEQFPEDLMLDVPDKLPKRVPARKISQAEARLERFKNANSRRNNVARTATSTTTTTSTTRKRSEPMFGSTGTNSRESVTRTRTVETTKTRRSPEPAQRPVESPSPKSARRVSKDFEPLRSKLKHRKSAGFNADRSEPLKPRSVKTARTTAQTKIERTAADTRRSVGLAARKTVRESASTVSEEVASRVQTDFRYSKSARTNSPVIEFRARKPEHFETIVIERSDGREGSPEAIRKESERDTVRSVKTKSKPVDFAKETERTSRKITRSESPKVTNGISKRDFEMADGRLRERTQKSFHEKRAEPACKILIRITGTRLESNVGRKVGSVEKAECTKGASDIVRSAELVREAMRSQSPSEKARSAKSDRNYMKSTESSSGNATENIQKVNALRSSPETVSKRYTVGRANSDVVRRTSVKTRSKEKIDRSVESSENREVRRSKSPEQVRGTPRFGPSQSKDVGSWRDTEETGIDRFIERVQRTGNKASPVTTRRISKDTVAVSDRKSIEFDSRQTNFGKRTPVKKIRRSGDLGRLRSHSPVHSPVSAENANLAESDRRSRKSAGEDGTVLRKIYAGRSTSEEGRKSPSVHRLCRDAIYQEASSLERSRTHSKHVGNLKIRSSDRKEGFKESKSMEEDSPERSRVTGANRERLKETKQTIDGTDGSRETSKDFKVTVSREHRKSPDLEHGKDNTVRSAKVARKVIGKHGLDSSESRGSGRKCDLESSEQEIGGTEIEQESESVERLVSPKPIDSLESSPKTSVSAEIDTERQEIVIVDQCIESVQKSPHEDDVKSINIVSQKKSKSLLAFDEDKSTDYARVTRSANESIRDHSTFLIRKPIRKRTSVLESNIYETNRVSEKGPGWETRKTKQFNEPAKKSDQNKKRSESRKKVAESSKHALSTSKVSGLSGVRRTSSERMGPEETLRSAELVRKAMQKQSSDLETEVTTINRSTESVRETTRVRKPEPLLVPIEEKRQKSVEKSSTYTIKSKHPITTPQKPKVVVPKRRICSKLHQHVDTNFERAKIIRSTRPETLNARDAVPRERSASQKNKASKGDTSAIFDLKQPSTTNWKRATARRSSKSEKSERSDSPENGEPMKRADTRDALRSTELVRKIIRNQSPELRHGSSERADMNSQAREHAESSKVFSAKLEISEIGKSEERVHKIRVKSERAEATGSKERKPRIVSVRSSSKRGGDTVKDKEHNISQQTVHRLCKKLVSQTKANVDRSKLVGVRLKRPIISSNPKRRSDGSSEKRIRDNRPHRTDIIPKKTDFGPTKLKNLTTKLCVPEQLETISNEQSVKPRSRDLRADSSTKKMSKIPIARAKSKLKRPDSMKVLLSTTLVQTVVRNKSKESVQEIERNQRASTSIKHDVESSEKASVEKSLEKTVENSDKREEISRGKKPMLNSQEPHTFIRQVDEKISTVEHPVNRKYPVSLRIDVKSPRRKESNRRTSESEGKGESAKSKIQTPEVIFQNAASYSEFSEPREIDGIRLKRPNVDESLQLAELSQRTARTDSESVELPRRGNASTDSIESALRRFDSIGIDTEHLQEATKVDVSDTPKQDRTSDSAGSSPMETPTKDVESLKEKIASTTSKRKIVEKKCSEPMRVVSKKSLSQEKVVRKYSTAGKAAKKNVESPTPRLCTKTKPSKSSKPVQVHVFTRKRLVKTRDSIDLARRPVVDDIEKPSCRRKLFEDSDVKIELGRPKSVDFDFKVQKIEEIRRPAKLERKINRNGNQKMTSKISKTPVAQEESNLKCSQPVKPLRSIKVIRESIRKGSPDRSGQVKTSSVNLKATKSDSAQKSTEDRRPITVKSKDPVKLVSASVLNKEIMKDRPVRMESKCKKDSEAAETDSKNTKTVISRRAITVGRQLSSRDSESTKMQEAKLSHRPKPTETLSECFVTTKTADRQSEGYREQRKSTKVTRCTELSKRAAAQGKKAVKPLPKASKSSDSSPESKRPVESKTRRCPKTVKAARRSTVSTLRQNQHIILKSSNHAESHVVRPKSVKKTARSFDDGRRQIANQDSKRPKETISVRSHFEEESWTEEVRSDYEETRRTDCKHSTESRSESPDSLEADSGYRTTANARYSTADSTQSPDHDRSSSPAARRIYKSTESSDDDSMTACYVCSGRTTSSIIDASGKVKRNSDRDLSPGSVGSRSGSPDSLEANYNRRKVARNERRSPPIDLSRGLDRGQSPGYSRRTTELTVESCSESQDSLETGPSYTKSVEHSNYSSELRLSPDPNEKRKPPRKIINLEHAKCSRPRQTLLIKTSTPPLRVTKSPSPDPALGKSSESGTRTPAASIRRNVFSSPSKSPEVAARGSVGIKSPEPRFTKRSPTLVTKSQDVPNSSDVVDASNLQNDCQLEDFIRESKIENESTKKSDDLDTPAGESKVNGLESPKKALPRKQSAEKLVGSPKQRSPTTPTHPRPISSLSTGSTRGQTYVGGKGKMATKSKSPAHGIAASRTHSAKSSSGVSNDALTACKICGRRFAHERVTLHEQICAKTGQKKRKQFDTVMFRVKGTDLESFVKKGLSKKTIESKKKKPEVKSNWRRKHEDFINAIRSAKQVQAHLAAGGKLSDLPPPPASDTSDYVQCPHCGRKFNQGAAERHIPKCQTMLHNKPNPRAPPKPKR